MCDTHTHSPSLVLGNPTQPGTGYSGRRSWPAAGTERAEGFPPSAQQLSTPPQQPWTTKGGEVRKRATTATTTLSDLACPRCGSRRVAGSALTQEPEVEAVTAAPSPARTTATDARRHTHRTYHRTVAPAPEPAAEATPAELSPARTATKNARRRTHRAYRRTVAPTPKPAADTTVAAAEPAPTLAARRAARRATHRAYRHAGGFVVPRRCRIPDVGGSAVPHIQPHPNRVGWTQQRPSASGISVEALDWIGFGHNAASRAPHQ
eukprot:SAG31_NODE_864_length_11392_cov_21.929868_2_plen_264_part_00